jgi:thiol:disulfide interchange protein DsbD
MGVVVFWTVIGLPMAFVSSNLDPSRFIFGIWWITLTIGVVVAGLGFGIMGLFNITLPQTVYAISPKVDTAWGSFVFGVMTAVLGLPCFGFVAGGLLAGTATLGAAKIMAIFFGLGVGMAAPYLVLSVWPQLLKFIPKTGPASELVKQVMGLLLLAAAAFFIAAGIKALLSEMPYLGESIAWWAVAFFVLLASVWMVVRTYQITVKPFARAFMPLLGLAMVGGIVFIAAGLASTAREDYEKRENAVAAAGGSGHSVLVTGAWLPYTPELLEKARAAGKVVVVDFTADWCINCKFLKRTVLDRDPVRGAVTNGDRVVLLEVDLTSRKAPGWKYLESLGQTGIPTLAIYGPGLSKPILLNAYTPDTVISAMAKAAGEKPLAASGKK